ncbi:MAG: MltA domain-containing protein [Betaproteobacteria bacterium]|nr:MltA domain-containing protein [Betaproteobacteria bacterium]
MTHIVRSLVTLLAVIVAAGCTTLGEHATLPTKLPPVRYEEVTFGELPGWSDALLTPSLRAFLAGCPKLAHSLERVCQSAQLASQGDERVAREFFESAFTPYAVISAHDSREGLVTGYYEPILAASRARGGAYQSPVLGVPRDLLIVDLGSVYPELANLRLRGRLEGRRVVPYYSRAEIVAEGQNSASNGSATPVIAWVADPVELFFLQIQGSGQLVLDNGERIRVGYAEQNGHPYRSLGRHLVDRGEMPLDRASMQGIKAWAGANPGKLQDALNHNASYVFFRELPVEGGPFGALGVPLSAEYSVAVDRGYIPLGAPVFLATTYPNSEQPLRRLMAAQDTGGAIRGALRADFYWGAGEDAGALAGRMRQRGRMWILWPRGELLPKRLVEASRG